MHKLDPIERLPDGTLFRLTPGQLRSVRKLVKRCCNYADGDCLPLDGTCPQAISHSLICRWFRHAVLPEQPKLEQAILTPKKLHRCQVCMGSQVRKVLPHPAHFPTDGFRSLCQHRQRLRQRTLDDDGRDR